MSVRPASWPRDRPDDEGLLVVDAERRTLVPARMGSLGSWLRPGDLLVLNDAATAPAAIEARTSDGRAVELRIVRAALPDVRAIALGDGDRFAPTEARGAPPALEAGDTLEIAPGVALVVERSGFEGRLLCLRTDAEPQRFFGALYGRGRPIQYAYVARPLSLYHVQTPFASRPWAAEMPSAGRPLSWRTLGALRRSGVQLGRLTHGAGISSTGAAALDAALPFPERYEIPPETAALVNDTRRRGGRVVAAGTTVVRALESAARSGNGLVQGGVGEAELVLGSGSERLVVDAVLTGIHEAGTSHHRLLGAFADEALLEGALSEAGALAFSIHEFGDSMLVLGESRSVLGVTGGASRANIAA